MADSEVRQKFEAWADAYAKEDKPAIVPPKWIAWDAWKEAYSLGMRAGEIAQREKIIKAVCTGCRLGWPEQGRPGHGIVIHVPPDPRGLYACQAVAIRALPAAPEEKNP